MRNLSNLCFRFRFLLRRHESSAAAYSRRFPLRELRLTNEKVDVRATMGQERDL
jgi:hypothetical protein